MSYILHSGEASAPIASFRPRPPKTWARGEIAQMALPASVRIQPGHGQVHDVTGKSWKVEILGSRPETGTDGRALSRLTVRVLAAADRGKQLAVSN